MVRKNSSKPERVLVVCHGSVCRSPLAYAVLLAAGRDLELRVRGVKSRAGGRAAKKVRDWGATNCSLVAAATLQAHRSAQLTQDDADWATTVLYMDGGNLKRLGAFGGLDQKDVVCLGVFGGATRVPDPNFMKKDSPEFDAALRLVVKCCEGFLADRAH